MVVLVALGPRCPRWAFTFDSSSEERAEALLAFGEPYEVVGTAQIQISRGEIPPMPAGPWTPESWAEHHKSYNARVVSWDCGPVSAPTIRGLVERCPRFAARRGATSARPGGS